jgi:uncharacterized phage protein gp47/JayE
MPFLRPTLTALRQQAMQDITASDLPGADGFLRRSVLRVLAWVQAGLAHLHYGYLDWIAKEAIPITCDAEFLEAWAGLKGITREAPTFSIGTWSGTGTIGTDLPSGALLLRNDGFQYRTTADATVGGGGTVTAPIIALSAGRSGNAVPGTPINLAAVIAGMNTAGSVAGAVTGGADLETDDSLRARMLAIYQYPPQGGSKSDYVEWCMAVPGVTRAWCAPMLAGAGTVTVFTMWDAVEAAHSGFPQGANGGATGESRNTDATGDQLAVANYIYPLQPVTALVDSRAPVAQALAFTVAGLNPFNATTQAAVTTALQGLLYLKASPLADTPIDQSDVDAAISAAPGVVSFRVTAPSFPQTPTAGNIFTLGTITWA